MKNFFIVGGQRCGTTWLYKMLDSHPDIQMAKPMRPEPKYFLNNRDSSIGEYFNEYFSGGINGSVFGEKSTSYYESENAARLIKSNLPNSKIIFLVRNPIDRAISNYKFSKENGLESRSLEDVFLNGIEPEGVDKNTSVNPFDYIKRGMYSTFIDKYISVFGRENVYVVCFEKIVQFPNEFKALLDFIEVDDSFCPSFYNEVVNGTESPTTIPHKVRTSLKFVYEKEVINMQNYIDVSYWQEFRG